MRSWERSFGIWCLIILALALALRLSLTAQFVGLNAPPDRAAASDQMDYELFAWRLAEGKGFTLEDGTPTARRMPGTSLVFLPAYCFAGRNYLLARLWFCFLSASTCVVTAWIGSLIFSKSIGILSGLMLAFYPNHAYFALHFLSEGPGGLVAAFATLATLHAWKPQLALRAAVIAGLAWGLAGLFRPNVLIALPLLLVADFIAIVRAKKLTARFLNLSVIGVVAALVLMPLVIRNYATMGIASLSTVNAPTLWGAHNHRILNDAPGDWIPMSRLVDEEHPLSDDEVTKTKQMWQYTQDFLKQNISSLPYLELMKIVRFASPFSDSSNRVIYWVFALSWLVCLALMLRGCAALIRSRTKGSVEGPLSNGEPTDVSVFRSKITNVYVLMTPFLAMFVTSIIYYGSTRFRDAASPNYIVLAAFGLMSLFPQVWKNIVGSDTEGAR